MDYPPEATFYVRLSLMNPKAGEEGKVSQIVDDLPAHFSTVPGLVRGCRQGLPVLGHRGGGVARLRGPGAPVRGAVARVMEPRIQYAKTADGVSVPSWTPGQ